MLAISLVRRFRDESCGTPSFFTLTSGDTPFSSQVARLGRMLRTSGLDLSRLIATSFWSAKYRIDAFFFHFWAATGVSTLFIFYSKAFNNVDQQSMKDGNSNYAH